MTDTKPDTSHSELMRVLLHTSEEDTERLRNMGVEIGKLYTDHGYPIDSAFDQLATYSKDQKLLILNGASSWLIQHKRNSGATDAAIDRQRRTNREMLDRFVKTGEVGIY